MDLETPEGIAEWIAERANMHSAQLAAGLIPYSAYAYNMRRLLTLGDTVTLRLDVTNRPVLRAVN